MKNTDNASTFILLLSLVLQGMPALVSEQHRDDGIAGEGADLADARQKKQLTLDLLQQGG